MKRPPRPLRMYDYFEGDGRAVKRRVELRFTFFGVAVAWHRFDNLWARLSLSLVKMS